MAVEVAAVIIKGGKVIMQVAGKEAGKVMAKGAMQKAAGEMAKGAGKDLKGLGKEAIARAGEVVPEAGGGGGEDFYEEVTGKMISAMTGLIKAAATGGFSKHCGGLSLDVSALMKDAISRAAVNTAKKVQSQVLRQAPQQAQVSKMGMGMSPGMKPGLGR